MILAVIPARAGSQRIPGKNVREFCGRPMLAWSIDSAAASGCFDRIIVSTDDVQIAALARSLGAETPFLRPAALADHHTGTQPVVAHAVDWMRSHGSAPAAVCCLYATAPFVRPGDLRRGLAALRAQDCDYAFAVAEYAYPVQRALRHSGAGVEMLQPEFRHSRSQDLEPVCHDAGQFYWGWADAWCAGSEIFSTRSVPVTLPRHRVQDIDTEADWLRAEWMFRALAAQP